MHYLYFKYLYVLFLHILDVVLYVEDILGALERWNFRENLPADAYKKVSRRVLVSSSVVLMVDLMHMLIMQLSLMCSYCKKHDESEVPDPYYGGPQGFEKVMHNVNGIWFVVLVSFSLWRNRNTNDYLILTFNMTLPEHFFTYKISTFPLVYIIMVKIVIITVAYI